MLSPRPRTVSEHVNRTKRGHDLLSVYAIFGKAASSLFAAARGQRSAVRRASTPGDGTRPDRHANSGVTRVSQDMPDDQAEGSGRDHQASIARSPPNGTTQRDDQRSDA
jgi:hypothetical protein